MTNRASLRFRFIEWGIALVILCLAIGAQAQVLTLQNPLPSPTQLTDISAMGSTLYAVGLDNTIIKSTDGGATWSQQYGDQPAIAMFNATFFRNANRGWAVGNANNGNGGFVEYTNNGGSTWGRQVIQQADYLKGVYFYNDTLGWTVGAGTPPSLSSMPFIYYTTNGGNTWTRQSVGVPTSSNAYMNGVSFANNATGWAVGYDPNVSSDFVLNTTNSGAAWNNQVTFPTNFSGASIAALNTSKIFVGGNFGGLATIFYTTDGGSNWATYTFNGNPGVSNGTPVIDGTVEKIVFPTPSVGYAAGMEDSSGIEKPFVLKTTNGGLSWIKLYNNMILAQFSAAVNSLSAADANNVYLCGTDNGGWVAATKDGGNSWSVESYNAAAINGGINPVLYDASFVDLNNGWAVGNASNFVTAPVSQYNPVAVTTTNGGATWTPFPTMPKNTDNVYYTGVSTTSKQNVWICEPDFSIENTFVIHSTNAGTTWNSMEVGVGVFPEDIKFSNDSIGILVGSSGESGAAYYTTDGGATWNPSRFYDEGRVEVLTRIGSFYGLTGWAIGSDNNGYIYAVTYDGGQSWYVTPTNIFGNSSPTVTYIPNGISFTPSGQFGWITGTEDSNGVYSPFIAYTNSGGERWTEESDNIFMPNWASPTPPYVHTATSQLDNVEDVLAVSALSAIAVTTQNNHSPYAGNRIIATVDGGNTWYNIDSSYVGTQYVRIAGKLTNRIDAWAVGQMGQIRHGYVNVPLFSAPEDSIFRKRIISWTPTDSVTESIAVCNPGTFPLTFEDWGINSDDNAWQDYTIIHIPSTIAPGQCDSIVIQFKPDEFNFRPAFLDILTNAVDTPNFEFDLVGTGGLSQVTSYPSSLFGTNIVPANGQEEVDTVWVCNDGTPGVYAEIHVTDVVLDNHDSCYSVVKGIDNRILPGNCDYFLVKFKPTSGGAKSGTLTFKTNTRAFPIITVNLGGVGGVRLIASDTSSLSFADTVGCPTTSTQCFVISNPGTLSTTVDSLSIAGVTPSDYSVQGTLPVTLAPGAHDTLCVTFAPTVEGTDSATLTLVNNSFNATSGYPVQLSGLGMAAQVSYSTKQVIRTLLPLNQTFDTSITIHNSGNIPAFVFPNISDINHWNLILPFTQTFSDSTVLNIRHLKTLNPRIDTLFVVLTWGNAGLNGLQGCGTSHVDTIEFIEQFGPNRVDEQSQIASSFALLQNYPNPFNPVTNIEYAIPQRANVTLTVYNMLGEAVQTLVNESEDMGTYKATFDASSLPNGNYYYELRAGSFMKRMMMTLAK